MEVYQSDFNAERLARERIAGEKADLEEQLRKAGLPGGGVHNAVSTNRGGDNVHNRGASGAYVNNSVNARGLVFENGPTNGLDRMGGGNRDRYDSIGGGRDQNYDNIPRTVNTRYARLIC